MSYNNQVITECYRRVKRGQPAYVDPLRIKEVEEQLRHAGIQFITESHCTKDIWHYRYYIIKGVK